MKKGFFSYFNLVYVVFFEGGYVLSLKKRIYYINMIIYIYLYLFGNF